MPPAATLSFGPMARSRAAPATSELGGALQAIAIGLCVIGSCVAAQLGGVALGIGLCVCLSLAIGDRLGAIAPIVIIVGFIFQNLFVSLLSPLVAPSDFTAIRSYNFIISVCIWAVCAGHYVVTWRDFPPPLKNLINASGIATAICVVYLGIGMVSDATTALVYFRNIGQALMLAQIGLILGFRTAPNLDPALCLIAWLVVGLGYFEFLFRDQWLDITNGHAFWLLNSQQARDSGSLAADMAGSGHAFVDIKDFFVTSFLNTPLLSDLDLQVYRLNGPNMHSISYAYLLAFLALTAAISRRYLLAAVLLPLLLFVGSKGALTLLIFTAVGVAATRLFSAGRVMASLLALEAAFLSFAIYSGLQNGDYHVLGLMGGLNGFMANPAGHGLGAGGNFSPEFSVVDWQEAQHAGATLAAVESSFGVILNQLGVMAFVVLGFYALLARAAWRVFLATRADVFAASAFAIVVSLANGVLQEEAVFSPLALSLIVLAASLQLGGAQNIGVLERARAWGPPAKMTRA